jgi:hypothetical protein
VLSAKDLVYRVPFLPMTREEVLQCATVCLKDLREKGQEAGKWQGLYWSSEVLHWLVDKMRFLGPISTSGCKTLQQKVRTYIEGPLSTINRRERACDHEDTKIYARRGAFTQLHESVCFVHHRNTLSMSIERENRMCVKLKLPRTSHRPEDGGDRPSAVEDDYVCLNF